jgi:hypothetical protein
MHGLSQSRDHPPRGLPEHVCQHMKSIQHFFRTVACSWFVLLASSLCHLQMLLLLLLQAHVDEIIAVSEPSAVWGFV